MYAFAALIVILAASSVSPSQAQSRIQFLRPATRKATRSEELRPSNHAETNLRRRDVSYSGPLQLSAAGKIRTDPTSENIPRYEPKIASFPRQAARSMNTPSQSDKCRGRSLSGLARSLKDQALSRLMDPGNLLMFGSSVLAAAIPLLAYITPNGDSRRKRAEGTQDTAQNNLAKRPLILNEWFGIQSRVDSMMGWIERSVDHLPNFPRLHPQECVKRSICEAHNEPEKHGAIGLFLRFLFPATNSSLTDRMDDMEFKVINKYRHAASFGLSRRADSNETSSASSVCQEKYEDCLVSLLDVAKNLMDVFLK